MEHRRLPLVCAICTLLVIPLEGGVLMVRKTETAEGGLSMEKTFRSNYNEMELPGELSRHRRSTNGTAESDDVGSGSGRSAIEEFYADKHNMAMYLILPLIILVYGGCSCIYCYYKCRRYLKKRIVVYQKQKRGKIMQNLNPETRWTPASNEIQIVKSMPNLRENTQNSNERPATSLALCSKSETQEVDQLLEELAIITDDKPIKKDKKPTAEITPVVQVKTKPIKQVESSIIDKPKSSKTPPVIVEVKPVVGEDKGKSNNDDVLPSREKSKKKKMILSADDIAEIMKYYNDKQHMPNVIPEDSENDKEISRKIRKKKIFSS